MSRKLDWIKNNRWDVEQMELRSFLAGIFFLFGVAALLPFVGVKVAITTVSPVLNMGIGVLAVAVAVFLMKNW